MLETVTANAAQIFLTILIIIYFILYFSFALMFSYIIYLRIINKDAISTIIKITLITIFLWLCVIIPLIKGG